MAHTHAHLRRALMLALTAALTQPMVTGVAYAANGAGTAAAPVMVQQQEAQARLDLRCAYLINKYGNVTLDLTFDKFEAAGFSLGDKVRVSFLDKVLELPVCDSYEEVPYGTAAIFRRGDGETYWVTLAMNSGDFASTYGIATRAIVEDGGVSWEMADGIGDTFAISLEMAEKGGYEQIREALGLTYTNVRADYPHLSDDEYANFREVTVGNIARGVLYRSASPIDPSRNRNKECDAALRRVGIASAIDLADKEEDLASYEGYADTYFASIDHLALEMTDDFGSAACRDGMAKVVRYIARNSGPYDIFCLEGKNRSGFVCGVLECLMGATADEVVADYMKSHWNYYSVNPLDASYDIIASMNIEAFLTSAFGIDSLEGADLAACATAYLKECGLTDAEISRAKDHLSKPATTRRRGAVTIHRRVPEQPELIRGI